MMKDLLQKKKEELVSLLAEKRNDLRKLRFDISGSKGSNTKAIRDLKKEVAQILTLQQSQKETQE
jgi:ribosomal protein L29